MKPLNSYNNTKPYADKEKLPAGGYILKILNVDLQEGHDGKNDIILLSYDISEGEFKDFFRKEYNSNDYEDKKWKGTYRIWVPFDDGSEADTRTMRRFKTIMSDFEDSNPGMHWDWNEQSLKNRTIGGIFYEKEYDINGRNGFYTTCYGLTTVDKIKSGKFKVPEPKRLAKTSADVSSSEWMNIPDDAGDSLPF